MMRLDASFFPVDLKLIFLEMISMIINRFFYYLKEISRRVG